MVKRVLKDPGLGLPGCGALTGSELRCFRESSSSRPAACISEDLTASLTRLAFSCLISEPGCMQ